jgi:hypothetical protein
MTSLRRSQSLYSQPLALATLVLMFAVTQSRAADAVRPLQSIGKDKLSKSQSLALDEIEKHAEAVKAMGTFAFNKSDFRWDPKGETSLTLPLGGDQTIEIVNYRAKRVRETELINWIGKDFSESVSLANHHGDITALIYHQGKVFTINSLGKNMHVVLKVDQSKLPGARPSEEELKKKPEDKKEERKKKELVNPLAPATKRAPVEISVLVAYTQRLAATPALTSRIEAAINNTNEALELSDIFVQINPVDPYLLVDFNETGNINTDLANFQNNAKVIQLRKQRHANICVLLTKASYAGKSAGCPAIAETAFSVVGSEWWSDADLIFPHEVGHLLGADHDPGAPCYEPGGFNHGHLSIKNDWRTMMAYDTDGLHPTRIKWWSNPMKEYPSKGLEPMGLKNAEDNARAINANARFISTLP